MKKMGLLTLLFISLLRMAYGQSKVDKIDKLLNIAFDYGKFNGSVLVSENGKIIYKKGFGFANMEWNIPNQPDTKFRLASITKQFTSMLVLQLVQQGKLKLDVPISTYLPDYPKPQGDVITLHHLLTHTSGIPNYTSFPKFIQDHNRDPHQPADLVRYSADSTLQFKPGEQFAYSNSGYVLLGYIAEKVTGRSYEQLLQEHIFTPLKMNNSGYDHNNVVLKKRAQGYDKRDGVYWNASYVDMSVPFSAGALYSTVEDLYLWDQALYTNQLLEKKYMDLLFTKYIPANNGHYGYGWALSDMPVGNTKEKIPIISHSGGIDGFNTLIVRVPSEKILVVLLNNAGSAPLSSIVISIQGILHDKPYDLPKKSVANSVADVITEKGIPAGLTHYKLVKDSSTYYLDEGEMNLAGYAFLKEGKANEAASVFKLNTEAFPGSSNVYDSYGESLLAVGDKVQAIENYKKSVRLNPANKRGIKVLEENGVKIDDVVYKASPEHLKLLEGEYEITNPPSINERNWRIKFEIDKGFLYGTDHGYRYKLLPVGEDEFVNPDDGASLVFDTKNKNEMTITLFGRFKFKKIS